MCAYTCTCINVLILSLRFLSLSAYIVHTLCYLHFDLNFCIIIIMYNICSHVNVIYKTCVILMNTCHVYTMSYYTIFMLNNIYMYAVCQKKFDVMNE